MENVVDPSCSKTKQLVVPKNSSPRSPPSIHVDSLLRNGTDEQYTLVASIFNFGMSLYEDLQTLVQDFNGCPEEVVHRIKIALMNRLCDPNNHSCTTVQLPVPRKMGKESILVRPIFTRGDDKVVLTVMVASDGEMYTFPYSECDAYMM